MNLARVEQRISEIKGSLVILSDEGRALIGDDLVDIRHRLAAWKSYQQFVRQWNIIQR